MGAPKYQRDRKRLGNRQMDTLVGISKGIIADGVVNQQEAEFLLDWLETCEDKLIESPLVDNLLQLLSDVLDDGFLDSDEAANLLDALRVFVGGIPREGEFIKPWMPLDDPPPPVIFAGKKFVFTGDFVCGDRADFEADVESMGGQVSASVTTTLDYFVIGTKASRDYKFVTHGTKHQKAVKYRDKGGHPAIISEQHFVQCLIDQAPGATH